MKRDADRWVIKLEADQIKGPYSTDAVCKMIASGIFNGNERICAYPEGEWKSLNKQPEFYEALLESLENPVEVDSKKAQRMDAETVIRASPHEPTKDKDEKKDFKDLKDLQIPPGLQTFGLEPNSKSITVRTQPLAAGLPPRISEDIQLSSLKQLQKKELQKFLPFILAGAALALVIGYLILGSGTKERSGWVLVAPNFTSRTQATDNRDFKKKAAGYFQKGQIEDLLLAQKNLVSAVEAAPRDLEAMGLLCMAYYQLWPYTKQSVHDVKSILTVTQNIRSINPISGYSEACQASYLTVKGQFKEARSLVEKTLDTVVDERFSLGPFLYLMKAEMLEYEQNYVNAGAYYQQASQLWTKWVTPRIGLARMYYKQKKFIEARTEFKNIFDLDKESKIALYGLGLVEFNGFQNAEKANQYFSTGFSMKQTVPKMFHVDALLAYAQLLIEKKDRSKALEVAELGYQINPSHRGLKELVITLGGDEKVENAQSEIILIGDQFARTTDHLAAVAQYKAAFELDPGNATAALKAAKSLWILNQSREAINWVQKSIVADPNQIAAYALKADYESQRYNFGDAAKTLQAGAKKSPQNYEIFKGQALLEYRKNNMLGAIQFGEKALKLYDADVELLSLLSLAHIAIYSKFYSARKEDEDRKQNSLKEAQRLSGRAIELEPSLPETQITYAKFLAALYGPLRGESYLKGLIKGFPYTSEYRIALAEFYFQEEKFSEASVEYLQVVELEAKNKKANFGLAESYRAMNKADLAQRYYNATSALDPSDVEPLFSNAKLLLETASGKEAQAKITQALAKFDVVNEINSNFPRVSYYLAKCYLELGDFEKAVQFVKEEKKKNPNLADPFLLAAEIFYRKEQFAECAAEYSMAIKLRPSGAELYVKSSICYRKSDAIEIAEDMLNIAMQKESGYPEIYREQGYIFEKKGQFKDANEAFETYLELSPNAPDRNVVQGRIRK